MSDEIVTTKDSPRAKAVDAPPSAAAKAPARRTVEEWAKDKGMLPMYEALPEMTIKGAQPGASVPLSLARSGIRAPRVNPEYHKFLAAKVGNRWPEGQELTEDEFDKAIADAMAVTCR